MLETHAPALRPRHAGLRHELRLGRLPDEHITARTICSAACPAPRRPSCIRCACTPITATGAVEEALAFNEVSLLRQLRQAAKIRITVDGRVRLAELILRRRADLHPRRVDRLQSVGARPDRAAVRQPAAADPDQRVPPAALARRAAAKHAPTCCSRCWRPTSARPPRSPTSPRCATCVSVAVSEDRSVTVTVLFDPDQGLSERIIAEQFTV